MVTPIAAKRYKYPKMMFFEAYAENFRDLCHPLVGAVKSLTACACDEQSMDFDALKDSQSGLGCGR